MPYGITDHLYDVFLATPNLLPFISPSNQTLRPDCNSFYNDKRHCYTDPNVCEETFASGSEKMPGTDVAMHWAYAACDDVERQKEEEVTTTTTTTYVPNRCIVGTYTYTHTHAAHLVSNVC